MTLQRYAKKRWAKAATTSRTRSGRFNLIVPTVKTGVTTYRVAVSAARGVRARHTGSFRVTVKAKAKPGASPVGGGTSPAGNPKAYAFLSRGSDPTAPIARWDPCTPIGYRVNTALASPGAIADVQGAIGRVSQASGLSFVYQGDTTVLPGEKVNPQRYPEGTDLVIAWARPGTTTYLERSPTGTVGPAGEGGASWWAGYDQAGHTWGLIDQGYVVLDAGADLAAGFGAGPAIGYQGTRGQLLMHELGHSVGLGHPTIEDKAEIMYPLMTRREAVWGAGDLNGLNVLGTASGCLYQQIPLG